MRCRKNKKGQIEAGFLVLMTLIVFGITLTTLYEKQTPFEKEIGERQAAVLAAGQEAEKVQLYLDVAATYTLDRALVDVAGSWYGDDLGCGTHRGVPVLYGDVDCMKYGDELYEALGEEVSVSFNRALVDYFSLYEDVPLLTLRYDLSFDDGQVVGFSTAGLPIPIMSKTSKSFQEATRPDLVVPGIEKVGATTHFDTWPLDEQYTWLSSCYGYRGEFTTSTGMVASPYHGALDIPAPRGTSVYAIASGVVTIVSENKWGFLRIDHGNGLYTDHYHLDSILVEEGDIVTKREVVATVGGWGPNSANDYGPHLDLRIVDTNIPTDLEDENGNDAVLGTWTGKEAVNPLCYLEGIPELTFNQNSLSCQEEGGGPYKFCDLYEPYRTRVINEDILYGGGSCTDNEYWHVEEDLSSQLTYEAWQGSMEEYGVSGSGAIVKLASNGAQDGVADGRLDQGRDTLLFIPCRTDPSKPVELIYYFHGLTGFTHKSFNTVMGQIKELMGEKRNFVLVYPELPWSWGDPSVTEIVGKTDRSKGASGARNTPWTSQDPGDLEQFHQDSIEIFSQFGIRSVGSITMLGHSAGGLAIRSASSHMNVIGVDKVILSDSDYWGSAQAAYEANPNIAIHMLAQDPATRVSDIDKRNGAHEPTAYAINFVKGIGGEETALWGHNLCTTKAKTACKSDTTMKHADSYTPGAETDKVFVVPGNEHVLYIPLKRTHAQISGSSLAWTVGDTPVSNQ
jgi:hypothetical protein